MKLALFEPSTHKAMKILFSEFTPEEIAILDGEDCVVPHMYSKLLKRSSRIFSFSFGLKEAKGLVKVFFFSKGNRSDVRDPETQTAIYLLFDGFLRCRQ